MAKNPYTEIINQIEQKAQLDEQKANTAANQQQQQAYIGYMTAKRDLGDTLAAQGISGGGSESAALGANVGYQRQRNAVNANRATEVSAIRQNALANKTSAESQSAQWQNEQQQIEETRFANTVTGYDTISKCDNAIDAAKDSGDTWKVPYLMAQRAALVEKAKQDEKEAAAKTSYSSSGSSGSSGGSNNDKTTTPNTQNGYYSNSNGSYYNNKTGSYGITGGSGGHYSY